MPNSGLPGNFAVRRPGWTDIRGWANPLQYYGIQLGDIDGDGQAELLGRGDVPPSAPVYGGVTAGAGPLSANTFDKVYGQWNALPDGPVLPDPGFSADTFFSSNSYGRGASTFLLGDIDGNGSAELLAVWNDWIGVFGYDPTSQTWNPLPDTSLPNGPALDWFGLLGPHGNYLTLALVDIDGDGQQELAGLGNASSGPLEFWHCDKSTYAWTAMPSLVLPATTDWSVPIPPQNNAPDAYYGCIRYGILGGQQHVFVRASDGVYIYSYSAQSSSWVIPTSRNGPPLSDAAGFGQPQYYRTFQVADVNGDGNVEILIRGAAGMQVWFYNAANATWTETTGPSLSDGDGWFQPEYYLTIQCADVNGDGQAEMIARSAAGIYMFLYDKTSSAWAGGPMGPPLTDQAGWNQPQYYSTIQCADVDGDGQAEIIARAANGVYTYKYNVASSAWAPASAIFPPFTGDQLTAYQQISSELMNGKAGSDLRSLYPAAAGYNWGEAQDNLTLWSQSSSNGAAWQAVAQQLVAEVNALQQVITSLGNLNTVLLDDSFAKNLVLLAAGGVVSSTYSDPGSSAQVEYAVGGNLLNIVWALSGLLEDDMGIGVIAGVLESAVGLASTFTGGNTIPTNPTTAPFSQMVTDLMNSFSNAIAANNANQSAIFSDYGLLMTIGGWIEEGYWLPTQDDLTAATTLAARAYAFYVIQTLAPRVWCIYSQGSFSSAPQPPCGYPASWTMSGVVTASPAATWIWPYYLNSINVNNEDTDCLDVSTLQNLFGPLSGNDPMPLAIPPTDVLEGKNGWSLPHIAQNYNPG